MLPVRQIGRMISSNQWTEELPHGADDDPGKADPSALAKLYIAPGNITGHSLFAEIKALAYIHFSAQIPSNHSTDVVSPPPDLLG
jgi:hypothetical protein